MSEHLFEVAFSGQISGDADLAQVKARVGKMFNADAAKIEQLFSGKRIVIKKNIDQPTASKYQQALNRAGALCEVKAMGGEPAAAAPAQAAAAGAAAAAAARDDSGAVSMEYETGNYGDVAPPPQVDPLGISAEQIADLEATIAPVGSELKEQYVEVSTPEFDIADLEVAPVGSNLGSSKKEPDPPLPNTSGISLAD